MSGHYTGSQARVREWQPLALYFHCASHNSTLVIQNAVISCPLVRNALEWINQLGVLMNRSGKYTAMFQAICVQNKNESPHPSAMKPLCPTRWLCRLSAIKSALDDYSNILLSLKEMADVGATESATKANGLLDPFQKGETLLRLMVASRPVALLEQLNSALEAKSATVSGMLEKFHLSISGHGVQMECSTKYLLL